MAFKFPFSFPIQNLTLLQHLISVLMTFWLSARPLQNETHIYYYIHFKHMISTIFESHGPLLDQQADQKANLKQTLGSDLVYELQHVGSVTFNFEFEAF